MSRGPFTWAGGAAASLTLHGGLALLLAAAIAPEPPPESERSDPAFDIASYPVRETQAVPQTPEAEAAAESRAEGLRAGDAAIPVSRADAAALPIEQGTAVRLPTKPATASSAQGAKLPEVAAAGPAVAAAATPSDRLAAATAPAAVPLPAAAPVAASLPVAVPSSAPVVAAVPKAPAVSAAALPKAPEVAVAAAPVSPAIQVVPPAAVLATVVQPEAPPLAAAAPAASDLAALVPAVAPPLAADRPQATALAGQVPNALPVGAGRPASDTLTTIVAAPDAVGAVPAAPERMILAALPRESVAAAPPETAMALPMPPPAQRVIDRTATGESLDIAAPPSQVVAETAQVAAPPLAASAAAALRLPSAQPVAAPLDPAPAPDAQPLPPSQPRATPADPATARAEAVAGLAPPAVRTPGTPPGALAAAAAPLAAPSERQTAATAWSGDGGGALDPVSLAAIQAFAKAGDPTGDGPKVRDRIGGLLASVPCARLQTVFDPDTGRLRLRGHVPDDGLRAPVLAALAEQIGPAIPLTDEVMILPRPQCGALAAIEAVGLAQSDDQQGDPRVVGDQPFAALSHFTEGERVAFEMGGADYPAYFYVDYLQADGDVIHLQPNDLVPLQRLGIKERREVGLDAGGRPAIDIRVAPPFGQEIMVAFASSVPLYDDPRPLIEPAAPYLDFLRDRVAAARFAHPDFRGEWFYFFVTTAARD